MAVKEQIENLLSEIGKGLYEKDHLLALGILCAVAGESYFLLGLPGTAKSEVSRRLKMIFQDATSFEYLMSRFSTPDEIFGPVSIKKLKDMDTYERQVEGYLPSADVVFLDEIWKAGPAIQNSLLTVLNEKIFTNGNTKISLPMKLLVAASNEIPEVGSGLEAIWDRFILRVISESVKDENNFYKMLRGEQNEPINISKNLLITEKVFSQWQNEMSKVTLQYTYPSPPFEDIDGVTSGNRIMDMLPTEFSYFAEPATEILFYQRFASKQLQQFSSFPKEMKMSTQQSSANLKGPIIISIDTSGSMYGKPMEFAKWVVTKVYEIAKITKRPLYVINFSVNSRTLDLSSEDGQDKLMHFFKNCLSGGSDGHEMIKEILCQLDTETYRYADSLIVSDFQFSSLNEELEERVVKAQNNGAKFYGLCTDAVNKYPGGNYSYKELLDKFWQVRL